MLVIQEACSPAVSSACHAHESQSSGQSYLSRLVKRPTKTCQAALPCIAGVARCACGRAGAAGGHGATWMGATSRSNQAMSLSSCRHTMERTPSSSASLHMHMILQCGCMPGRRGGSPAAGQLKLLFLVRVSPSWLLLGLSPAG